MFSRIQRRVKTLLGGNSTTRRNSHSRRPSLERMEGRALLATIDVATWGQFILALPTAHANDTIQFTANVEKGPAGANSGTANIAIPLTINGGGHVLQDGTPVLYYADGDAEPEDGPSITVTNTTGVVTFVDLFGLNLSTAVGSGAHATVNTATYSGSPYAFQINTGGTLDIGSNVEGYNDNVFARNAGTLDTVSGATNITVTGGRTDIENSGPTVTLQNFDINNTTHIIVSNSPSAGSSLFTIANSIITDNVTDSLAFQLLQGTNQELLFNGDVIGSNSDGNAGPFINAIQSGTGGGIVLENSGFNNNEEAFILDQGGLVNINDASVSLNTVASTLPTNVINVTGGVLDIGAANASVSIAQNTSPGAAVFYTDSATPAGETPALVLNNLTIQDNFSGSSTAASKGGGLAVTIGSSTTYTTINQLLDVDNTVWGVGGGMFVTSPVALPVINSTIDNNKVWFVSGASFTTAVGGGIYTLSAGVSLDNDIVADNTPNHGTTGQNLFGPAVSTGYNDVGAYLSGDSTIVFQFTDLENIEPNLDSNFVPQAPPAVSPPWHAGDPSMASFLHVVFVSMGDEQPQ